MLEMASRTNKRFKNWLELLESKGIREQSLALVSGAKVIAELLEQRPEQIVELLLPSKGGVPQELNQGVRNHQIEVVRLTAPLFQELDVVGTRYPLAVVKVSPIETWQPSAPKGVELVVSLSDPNNLGALLRSAEAFGVRRVILTKECSSPFLPRALRAASGSTFRLELFKTGSLKSLNDALSKGATIGLDMNGENIHTFKWPQDLFLVVGEEGQGLPADLSLTRLSIPMQKPVESLNAMVATSLALFSYQFNRSSS